jgi:hypothetical protein
MSISTYADLRTSVANWLKRSDMTDMIPDLIMLGEKRIYRELRIKCMETALSDTISGGVIAVPSDYLELKFAYIDGSPTTRLDRQDPEFIYATYPSRSADGVPRHIAREGDSFIFGPYPDAGYTVKGIYYKTFGNVSDSAHALFTKAPDLYLFAALSEAAAYKIQDARIPVWEGKYMESKTRLQSEDKRERFSGSPLQMTAR